MNIPIILLLAFSLSMDAFSLSLAYGTLNFNKKTKKQLAVSVGIFHFIMPILGMRVNHYLKDYAHISFDIITLILFIYIGVNMIVESKKEKELELDNYFKSILLFSTVVSVDSFTVGIALNKFSIIPPLFFSLFSAIFTFLGLTLGEKVHKKYGKGATILGGIIFIILGILYI
jgi:Predicted membrane protein